MPTTKLAPARRAALKLFSECRRREARARDMLRDSDVLAALDSRDRALATRLVLGTIAARGEVDRAITSHLHSRSVLEPLVRDALRIAAFEILYLDIPDHVAVSQGVELVRSVSKRAAGLGNAVLRRVADEDSKALAASQDALDSGIYTIDDLQRVGALPEWLAAAVRTDLDPAAAADYARRTLEPPCQSVAANTAKHTVEECRELLAEAGCDPADGPVAGSFVLGCPAALNDSDLVANCDVLPCDLAAQEVVATLAPTQGQKVLEVGQGRGTKSVLLAATGARLTSVELDPKKSALASARMQTAGVADRVHCVCDDGQTLEHIDGTFDLVFVDAPCSGTGTLSRHPEISWSLREDAVSDLAALQLRILRNASIRVAPGGRLAYSTCSVLAAEDADVVSAFLASPEGAGFTAKSMALTSAPDADRHFLSVLER
ncbi:RsmB/NOP family class I SAM-dependent RNA methyltransferase [Paratractidigestivibacter sp.]|uniref:RsmB/NOP family class I SAM-dependent RNA methyltransferase n=1 Tax=Paratractidigestivibacter sp. TaxID=2847316 RepID=UPI002AC997BD|nr:transcription antitermination factor NusB [Paratractidigestivibacter sp.]